VASAVNSGQREANAGQMGQGRDPSRRGQASHRGAIMPPKLKRAWNVTITGRRYARSTSTACVFMATSIAPAQMP